MSHQLLILPNATVKLQIYFQESTAISGNQVDTDKHRESKCQLFMCAGHCFLPVPRAIESANPRFTDCLGAVVLLICGNS